MYIKIAIIGAGVIGLTSASKLLELIPNCRITILAESFSPETTSDVSAGYWEPYCLNGDQNELILKWGKETYDIMLKKAFSEDANKYGIQTFTAFILQDSDKPKLPYWSNIVHQFKTICKDEIFSIVNESNKHIKSGYSFLSTSVVVSKYLRVLTKDLTEKGVLLKKAKLDNLKQFIKEQGKNYDYIINCTGVGARQFVPDLKVHSVRGQVLRVKAPWIKHCVMLETNEITYIIPLSDLIVLGGTQQVNNYNLEGDENEFKKILERCSKYIPSLKDAEIVSKHVGLRPGRVGGVRLEMEILNESKVIHNYGHGGSGVTISWGCASSVAELVLNDLKKLKLKAKI